MAAIAMSSPQNLSRYPKRKRREVQYKEVEEIDSDASDLEQDLIPYKRARISYKPLPKQNIFPFLSLPGEIRNQIYQYCLPAPTKLPATAKDEEPGRWFYQKRKHHRRTIGYLASMDENVYDSVANGYDMYDLQIPADGSGETKNEKHLAVNIISVCKQIYEEAAPMMYNEKFVFACPDALFNFAANLSPRSAKLVRSIEIRSWGLTRYRMTRGYMAITMLAAKGVTNLESLYINCRMAWIGSSWRNRSRLSVPQKVARKVYRDCHVWIEAVATASGEWDKSVDILKINPDAYDDFLGVYKPRKVPIGFQDDTDFPKLEAAALGAFRKELTKLVGEGL